jgi:hypothetical protein
MRPLAFVLILLAVAAAPAQTWKSIQSQYDRFAKAYVANDVKAMLGILSSTYTLTNEDGRTIDYKAYKAQLEERKERGLVSSAYTVQILSLDRKGDTATLATKEVTKGIGGTEHVHRYRDVWKLEQGVWRLASTTTLGHSQEPVHRRKRLLAHMVLDALRIGLRDLGGNPEGEEETENRLVFLPHPRRELAAVVR